MPFGAAKAAIRGDDVPRAEAAARTLAAAPAGVPHLLRALDEGVAPSVAAVALEGLAARRHSRALPTLLDYARHRDASVRARAVTALGAYPDARARAPVLAALGDHEAEVRAAAAAVVARRREKAATASLFALFQKGDPASAEALAAVATPEVARQVVELVGKVPDPLVADCLGAMLLRADLGPEQVYVDLVNILGTIPGEEALVALSTFLSAVPESSPRPSRREAQAIADRRLGGAP